MPPSLTRYCTSPRRQWNFKRLDNGAFHIIPPTLDTGRNAAELRAVGKDDLLFVKNETGSEDADPNIIQEWEVLSSARDGGAIEPLNGKFKGWYMSVSIPLTLQ